MANGQGLDAKRLNGQGLDAKRYSRELQDRIGGFKDNAMKMIDFAQHAKNLALAPKKTASSNNPYNDAVSNWGVDNPWGTQRALENNGGKWMGLYSDEYNDMPGYEPTFDEKRAMARAQQDALDQYERANTPFEPDTSEIDRMLSQPVESIGLQIYDDPAAAQAAQTNWSPTKLDIDFQDPQAMQAADANSNLLIDRYMNKRVDDISSFLNNAMDNYRARKEALANQAKQQQLGNNDISKSKKYGFGKYEGGSGEYADYPQNRGTSRGGGFSAGGRFSGKAFGR